MNKLRKIKIYSLGFFLYTILFIIEADILSLLHPVIILVIWLGIAGLFIFLSEYLGIVEDFFG